MDQQQALGWLEDVKSGKLSPEEALLKFRQDPFEDMGYARIDHHRGLRQGVPEVIFGQGKTPEQTAGIVSAMIARGEQDILITRMPKESKEAVEKIAELTYYELPKIGIANPKKDRPKKGHIAVVTGGTSDLPVAEEAAIVAEVLGNRVERVYDVGVAGLHRLLHSLPELMKARVVIAVAGMEGALASVVGGLVSCPVIAVPTSVGYGASFGGLSALLSMLNSCASGVSVVNIDNGFGAGFLASRINQMKGIDEE
ncbi:MAG: nickel pincer cofactor biosynthesis protein LarB [Clostridia bacterium]|nr:nickel pincer cofactor biosynthesis protein LarB [Clostridia bacterium]